MSIKNKSIYVPLPLPERGKSFFLSGDPKGKNFMYPHGNSIIVRSIEDPLDAFVYSEHAVATTAACYAPSGFYIASADKSGKIRIWDTTQEEHLLKYEYQPLAGAIKDITWSPDSKRIAVCGEGREIFAHAFLWDSGSSVGELTGHSKFVNGVSMRQERPFRLATASEDSDSGFYAGPPFKLQHLNKEHSRFVNCVRFAPDGHVYVTGGADGKLFVYDGKEGKLVAELNGGEENAHGGQVYGVSWSADSKRMVSCSGDKTVKMWDVDENKLLKTFTFGNEVEDQQLAVLWQGDHIISVSLSGFINYLDEENPATPKRILKGHNKAVKALAVDADNNSFYGGGYDGRVSKFGIDSGECTLFSGTPAVSITDIKLTNSNVVVSSLEDAVRVSPKDSDAFSQDKIKCESAPADVATKDGVHVAACYEHVTVVKDGNATATPIKFQALSVAMNPNNNDVAVGGDDKNIHIYSLEGTALKEKQVVEATGSVEALAYSPDGNFLASGDAGRNVFVFETGSYEKKFQRWKYHTAKVTCLAWAPNSQCLATGSLDTNLIVWNMNAEMKRITSKAAHPVSGVSKVAWASDTFLFSAGNDSSIKSWEVVHH